MYREGCAGDHKRLWGYEIGSSPEKGNVLSRNSDIFHFNNNCGKHKCKTTRR